MKLLIVTQKVDRKDPILGFFHRWIEEFAKHCDHVHVIGQYVGEYNLPQNVSVHSLGKETGASLFSQIWKFRSLQWKLRREYDAVFVHMTPIWVLLGCPQNCLLKKRVYLWYEARGTRWPLRLSLHVSALKKVFSASPYGMPLKTKKSIIVGHGIDLERFTPSGSKDDCLFVTVGRITRSKHLEVILHAFALLPAEYRLSIVGTTITDDDQQYRRELGQFIGEKGIGTRVSIGSMTQDALVPLLQRAEAFLHASETSLDKAVLEAMACGCPVVSTAPASQSVLPSECHASDAKTMRHAIENITNMNQVEKKQLLEKLQQQVQKHSLEKLIQRLIQEMIHIPGAA